MGCPVRSKSPRRQAAYAARMMAYFRDLFASAKRYPEGWRGLPADFAMDPPGRRRAFDSWRARHRAMVARLPRLP